jgi:dienelactone hydrolase
MGVCASGLWGQTAGLRERIIENHRVFAPSGSGPFPTIIAIPGCSGVAFSDPNVEASHPSLREDDRLFRRHYPRAADRLRREGFAVLLIQVHGAEGLVTACRGEIPSDRIAEYIDDAVAWAAELDFVDQERLHLIGWSMGGGGVLAWLRGTHSQAEVVRSAIVVYPDCSIREPLTTETRLLMLLGGADDIAEPAECEEIIARSGARPSVLVHTYPGARHGYDIEDAPPVLDLGGGMTIGYQQAAAEATWVQILTFLSQGR